MDKVDKIFKTTSIILLLLIMTPIIGLIILLSSQQEFLVPIVFGGIITSACLIPIGNLILIVTFFIKLLSKNKTKKIWYRIMLNFISIIFYSYVSFLGLIFLLYIFVSDGIET